MNVSIWQGVEANILPVLHGMSGFLGASGMT